jgi:hypothetical protein
MYRLGILFLLIYINPAYGQKFKITPNNNQYYFTDYIQKAEAGSILKIVLIFNVTNSYKPTFVNPEFSWNDSSGILKSNMVGPGKYQIDLDVVYKKTNANTIALSEFETPRVMNVKISDLKRHLIRIDYVSDLIVDNIEKKISVFNPRESRYEELINFVYDYNEILRKYDPYCDLVLPEIITDDFSKKITQSINGDWKKTKINALQSTSKNFVKVLSNDPQPNSVSELIDCLSKTNTIKLNYYNAYRISYLTNLLDYCLNNPGKNFSSLIIKSFEAIKQDSTDRNLIITHVTRNGFQINDLSVAYTPHVNANPEIQKPAEYFKCPTSPTYSIFSGSQYTIWVENKDKQRVSSDKLVNCVEEKFKEIVLPVNSSLAIVKLQNDFGKNLNYDMLEFERELTNLIIKYKCLYLSHVSLPVNAGSRK